MPTTIQHANHANNMPTTPQQHPNNVQGDANNMRRTCRRPTNNTPTTRQANNMPTATQQHAGIKTTPRQRRANNMRATRAQNAKTT